MGNKKAKIQHTEIDTAIPDVVGICLLHQRTVKIERINSMSTGSNLIAKCALRAVANVNSSKLPKELAKSSAAFLSSAPSGGKHTLPDLAYDYNALERKFLVSFSMFSRKDSYLSFHIMNQQLFLPKLWRLTTPNTIILM